ncbi:MAG: serine/threonine protein kinase [Spirochaetales bacterium]|nr:serine/threonine protein kinase [Spirochaetales bacterium]
MKTEWSDFSGLDPALIHESIQKAYGIEPGGLLNHMPSYINRVYEIEGHDGLRYIVKFYRPGRWDEDAIMDEHDLLFQCQDEEIPVVAPLLTEDGSSLCVVKDFYFALFPKKSGRLFETDREDDYIRLGRLIARVHNVSAGLEAPGRMMLTPEVWKKEFLGHLTASSCITAGEKDDFVRTVDTILELSTPLFGRFPVIPCHGDCHRGNILDRAREGLMLIDFDDMCLAPEIQDLWMLLPGYAGESRKEFMLMCEGYSEFRPFDERQFLLIEPLRALRMLYHLSWSARQLADLRFREQHPDWGTAAFWSKEIGDFRIQLQVIRETLEDKG